MKLQLKEVYTRLRVVSRRQAGSSEIDVDDIFGSSEEDNGQLVLVEGSPGIGKTTFCLKLAHDWANGAISRNFPSFKLVFLLKCRDMKGDILEDIDLVEEIFEQLLPEDLKEKTKGALVNFLENSYNQNQILIIFDGLDELPEKLGDRLDKVLGRKKLSFCYVLATTRQEKGIHTREQFQFDICLAIEGFRRENSFEYIRKHFRNIGPEHSSKGERLIEEVKQNPLLSGLQRNPLNLLLLCVIYEDYEGSLPSSATDLYQTILRCLLKRYCSKENLKASQKDEDLDKQFEITILALGELAWKCLLNDRLSFYEDELEELERSNESIVARRLGLVYKEESLKRLKPRHTYSFLHKTFQEYLAASYIAHKLRGSEFHILKQVLFPDLGANKFRQVFFFVCGILQEEASTLFEQVGNMLQKQWDWLECENFTAAFFIKSWKETGNSEKVVKALCSSFPFPRVLHLGGRLAFLRVLKACAGYKSEVQTAAEVHFTHGFDFRFEDMQRVAELPNVKSVILHVGRDSIADGYVDEILKANRTLKKKLAFALSGEIGEGLSTVLDVAFSSVGLRICGSLGPSSLQAVEKLLFHQRLSSLSITICGDVQESLIEALARGLEVQKAVKVLDLCVNGKLSCHGAYLLEKGILRNKSLRKVKVSVNGELPENWQAVEKNVRARLAEKAIVSAIYPNTFSKVKDSQVTHLSLNLSKTDLVPQNVTLNVWGELSGNSSKAVCEVLLHTPVSHLTLNIHGQLSDEILRGTARCVEEQEKPSSITINAWVQMTEKENKLIKELGLDKNPSVSLNVRGTSAPLKESGDSKVMSSDEPQSLISFLDTRKICNYGMNDGWRNRLVESLARNISLKSLTLEINTDFHSSREWKRGLVHALARNTSLESLTLKIYNSSDMRNWRQEFLSMDCLMMGEWELGLVPALPRNTSLESLTLKIYNYSSMSINWRHDVVEGLARRTSLKSLTMEINNYADMGGKWGHDLVEGFARNASLKSLTLTINNYCYISIVGALGLVEGLARNKSPLKSITVAINNYGDLRGEWGHGLVERLTRNTSLNSLTLAINNYCYMSEVWGLGLVEGLAGNTSLNSLTLTANNYGDMSEEWGCAVLEGLTKSKTLPACNLTVNICGNC